MESFKGDVSRYYIYGLIDLHERQKLHIEPFYKLLYIVDNHLLLQLSSSEVGIRNKLVINEKTFLGQYIWKTPSGNRYLNHPIIACSDNYAVISKNIDEFSYKFIMIDVMGHWIEECDIKYKDWFDWLTNTENRYKIESLCNKVVYNSSMNQLSAEGKDYVRLDDYNLLVVDIKWEPFINNIIRKEKNNYEEEISIIDSLGQKHNCYFYTIINNLFFCIGYNKPDYWRDQKYNLILDSKRNILYKSNTEFKIEPCWTDRILINDTIILDKNGNLFQYPLIQRDRAADYTTTGYAKLYSKHNFFVIDNEGNCLTPPIFPPTIYEPNLSDYFENLKSISDSDAYEGLEDARWNTD